MKKYADNSPQAMARVLVMLMVSDGNMDPREIDELEHLDVYRMLDIERAQFIQILHDYCNDLTDEAEEDGRIHLIDRQRIDDVLDTVSDPKKRLLLATLALDLSKADEDISDPELAIFAHLLERWRLTLDDIADTVSN